MSIKIVHTADNHLDPTLRKYSHIQDVRRRDFWKSFERVLNFTYEKRPDFLIIAGDLFDKINPRNPIRTLVMRHFKKIHENGTIIIAVGGHHDMPKSVEEGASPLREFAEAGYLVFIAKRNEPEVMHFNVNGYDVCISGMSFNSTLLPNDSPLSRSSPATEGDINIFVTHYPIEGFNAPSTAEEPMIKASEIPKGLHYFAAGHLHLHQERKFGDTLVAYPGSTERRSFNEETDSDKGFLYLELAPEGVVEKQFIKVPARNMKTIEYIAKGNEDYDITEDIVNYARKFSDKELIFRIRVKGDITLDTLKRYSRDKIIRELLDSFFIVFLVDTELRYKGEYVTAPVSRLTPLESFKSHMNTLLENATSEEDKKLIRRAKEIGIEALEEAGGW